MAHFVLALSVFVALFGCKNKIFLKISFLILFVFAAVRYMYGNDYSSYYNWFEYISAGGSSPYGSEVLFTWLNEVLPSFFLLIALISAIYVFLVYLLISKNLPAEYAWVGVFIFVVNPYLFLMNLSALRQCIATCLFIVAVECSYRRQFLKYCILIGIAALFHKSSIILLPIYFIANDKPVKSYMCWINLAVLLFVVVSESLTDIIAWVISFFDSKNYTFFVEQEMQNSVRATLLSIVYYIYALFNQPRLSGKKLMYTKLYTVGMMCAIMAYRVSMMTRIQMYFDIFSVVALPMIFADVQSRGLIVVNRNNVFVTVWECVNKYAIPILIIVIYILRYYSFYTNPAWKDFFEYQTIFSLM